MKANLVRAGPQLNSHDHREIRDALARFIADFNNLEMTQVASHFAEDATMFPRVVMSNDATENVVLTDFCRENGPAPFRHMEVFAEKLRAESPGPPYMTLNPEHTKIQVIDNTAIVTFHLVDSQRLARRTVVFVKRDDVWKILHLHASNVRISR